MNERDFIYWLQGFLELSEAESLNEKQIQIVKDHIELVLKKETPTYIVSSAGSDELSTYPLVEPKLSTTFTC